MKCPDCGNINVKIKEQRETETAYHCSECPKDFVYDSGKSNQ